MFGCCIYLYIALYLHCPVYSAPYIYFFVYVLSCLVHILFYTIVLNLLSCMGWICPIYIFQLHMLSCMGCICPLYIPIAYVVLYVLDLSLLCCAVLQKFSCLYIVPKCCPIVLQILSCKCYPVYAFMLFCICSSC